MGVVGFINGEFVNVDKKVLPIDERGHQFGDGVYEVIRVYNGVPFLLDEHLERLERSAEAIKIKLQHSRDDLKEIITEGIKKSDELELSVYLQITRGIDVRNHLFPKVAPSITMTVRPVKTQPQELYLKGASVFLTDDKRWECCYIKSLNLLPNILVKQEAFELGHQEGILVRNGYITEGSSSNVFAVIDGTLYTTPLSNQILGGITRQTIIKLAKENGIPVNEMHMSEKFFLKADEAFYTSTTVEIAPIIKVNDKKINDGSPGAITQQLHGLYKELHRQ